MKKILFFATHTLYYKVLIPIIIELIKKDHEVLVLINKPNFYKYSPEKYSHKPTANNCINKYSIEYVASLIDYTEEYKQIKKNIKYVFFNNIEKYDIIIGLIKDFERLISFKNKGVKEIYIVGYQHMPFLLSLNKKLLNNKNNNFCKKIFLEDNQFSKMHGFQNYLINKDVYDYTFLNFTYLDKIYQKIKNTKQTEKKYVLVFHPGGYRDIITKYGENKKNSYLKQKNFIKIICNPIIKKGLIPVLKVHPLYAKYHSLKDLVIIKDDLIKESKSYEKLIITDEVFWDYAIYSRFILTIGSSSLYELYGAGIKNILVINFFGKVRSDQFKMFENVIIHSEKEFIEILNDKNLLKKRFIKWNHLLNNFYQAYSTLNNGKAVEVIVKNINN